MPVTAFQKSLNIWATLPQKVVGWPPPAETASVAAVSSGSCCLISWVRINICTLEVML